MHTDDQKYAYRTYIKDLFLELPDYKHHHSPFHGDADERFIGREKIHKRLLSILKNGEENGAYLITGYRGMGKTSFVKKVVSDYQKETKMVSPINISFAQIDLKETDILRQITKGLIDVAERNWIVRLGNVFTLSEIFKFVLFLFCSTLAVWMAISFDREIIKSFSLDNKLSIANGQNTFWFVLALIIIIILFSLLISYLLNSIKAIISATLNQLYKNFFFLTGIGVYLFIACLVIYNSPTSLSTYLGLTISTFVGIGIYKKSFNIIKGFNYAYEFTFGEVKLYKKLQSLYERSNATITKESGLQSSSSNLPFGFVQKDVKYYPIANAKEIEYELINILAEYNKFKSFKRKFIIIFDELDKVEPSLGKSYFYDDSKVLEQYEITQSQLNDIRQRKRMIINILASLKHFITEANARYIFIAGREMFDAALADIADRQSSISSIFHQIIYVDSFLKDKEKSKDQGLTDLVEVYLREVLLPKEEKRDLKFKIKNKFYRTLFIDKAKKLNRLNDFLLKYPDSSTSFLKKYFLYLINYCDLPQKDATKIIFTLQNFIIYLTYRSNGSPKKLTKLLEDYIYESKGLANKDKLNNFDSDLSIVVANSERNLERLYLRFSVKSQYKFGFITYLYRPFLLGHSQFIKKYSDNVLVSTPYLMDHLIKFHPFAFSVQNLELLPEVLSANRNPILRYFIEELIDFLGQNHIRETEIGLFEYKFYNKSYNEIGYLSKIFEEESAAFNFTLDESYFIKIHLRNKIKDLRQSYKDFKDVNYGRYIYSISFLNGLLGDACYFDQEFDEAIVSYQDALQQFRTLSLSNMQQEEFTLMIRLKLKLGLILEKMKSYEAALSVYTDAIKASQRYFNYEPRIDGKDESVKISHEFISLNELLQITNQAYLACIFLQEKIAISGITIEKTLTYKIGFKQLVDMTAEKEGYNWLVMANFYSNIGTLFYYKNLCPVEFDSLENTVLDSSDPKEDNKAIKKYLIQHSGYRFEDGKAPDLGKYIDFKGNKDFRFSYLSFLANKQALQLLLSGITNKTAITEESIMSLGDLLVDAVNVIEDYQNIYNKTFLKNTAHVISKIGDSIFTILSSKRKFQSSRVLEIISKEWYIGTQLTKLAKKIYTLEVVDREDLKKIGFLWFFSKDSELLNTYLEEETRQKIPVDSKLKDIINPFRNGYRVMGFLDLYVNNYFKLRKGKDEERTEIGFIVFLYYLSGRFYSKAGKSVSMSFQLRKILQVIRATVNILPEADINQAAEMDDIENQSTTKQSKLILFLEEAILNQILEITSWNSNSTDRPQIYKYKNNFSIDSIHHPKGSTKYVYFNTSNNPEVKEAVLHFAGIKIKSLDFDKIKSIYEELSELELMHPYSSISSQFTRIQEFELQITINANFLKSLFKIRIGQSQLKWEDDYFKIFKKTSKDSFYNPDGVPLSADTRLLIKEATEFINKCQVAVTANLTILDEYEQLTANSIFCLIQVIAILRVYEINFYMGYAYLATFHRKLGNWLKHYSLCKELREQMNQEPKINDYLEKLLGKNGMIQVDATSQYQIALQYFHKAKQVHSNGPAYQSQINNFIYLEDDYNDNLYHFGIALERHFINSYHIRRFIKELELELKDSPLYEYSSYANTEPLKLL